MQSSNRGVCVRDSVDADMAAITAIYAHHVLHGTALFETEAPSTAQMEQRFESVGIPSLRAKRSNPPQDSIYLRTDAIGQGIGRRLLHEPVAHCEALDLRQITAAVGDSASLASIRLHESWGFRLIGVLRSVGYKRGRWLDSGLLQRALGAGAATPPT